MASTAEMAKAPKKPIQGAPSSAGDVWWGWKKATFRICLSVSTDGNILICTVDVYIISLNGVC
jgi:hypothetical protein